MKKIIISVLIISILVISLALGQQIIKEPIIKEPIINDPVIVEPTPIFDVMALDSSKENTITRIRTLTDDVILTEKTLTKVYEKEDISLVSSKVNTFNKLLISDRYVSADAVISEPVLVRIQTNKSNTVFGVYKHPSYGVSSDVVLNDGYFFKEVTSNDDGVVEFLVDSFSTIYLGIPSLYFDSSGVDYFRTINIHDYTNKEVYALAIPNYADSNTQLVFPTPDLSSPVFIDGFGYAVEEYLDEYTFYVEQASSDIIQSKQITIIFTDGTMTNFMFYSHYVEPSSTGIYPSDIIMDYSEVKTIDISQFISKSDFLLTGYKQINNVILLQPGTTTIVSGTSIDRSQGHIDINGNGQSETSEVKLVLRQNRYIDIYSKTTDFNYDINIAYSNWFGITNYLKKNNGLRPNIDVSDTTPYSPVTLQLTTLTPYNVGSTYATIRGRIDNLASDGIGGVVPVDVRFEYREIGTSIWKTTPYQALGVTTPSHYSYELSGLKTSTSYEYRITAISSTGTTRASTNSFTTLSAPVLTKPVIINQLPSVSLEAVNSQSITIGNYFSGHDYIDVFIEGVGQTHILNKPSSGINNVVITDTDLEYEVQYSSTGIITIIHREGNKNPLLTVIAGNEAGTSTITRYLTLTDSSITPPSEVSLLDGLVSYWKFDETTGTTASDSHGSNDGTINGATINQNGKIGKTYYFDGVVNSDYITTPINPNTLIGNGAFTISTWVKTNGSIDNYRRIWSMGVDSAAATVISLLVFDDEFNVWSQVGTSGGGLRWTSGNGYIYNTDTWYHVTVTRSGTTIKVYVNGVEELTSTDSANGVSLFDSFVIGADTRRGGTAPYASNWLGNIDEMAFYNRALSSTEVSALYDIQKDGLESGSYPFEALESQEVNVISTISDKSMDLSSTLSLTISDYFEYHNVYSISTNKGVISQGGNFDDADIRYDLFNDELLITSKTSSYNDTISVSASNELGTETLSFNLFVSDEGDYTGVIGSIPIQVIPISDSVIIPVDDYFVDYSDISISFVDEYLSFTPHLFVGQSYTINNGVDDVVTISLYETLGEYFISIVSEGIETSIKPITLYLSTVDGVSQYSFNYIITDTYGGVNSGLTPILAYNPNLHGWINGNPYYEWFINLDTYWSGIDEFFILDEDNEPVYDTSSQVSIYERFYRNHLGYNMTALSPILNFKKNEMGNVIDYQVLDLFYEYENRNSEDVFGYFGFMIYDEFDELVDTETYYFAPLVLTGLNKYDGLPEKTISWDSRGDTYIINLFDVYDNLFINTDYPYGRVVHDVKFFHESLFDFDRKTNTEYEPFYLNNGAGITLSDFVDEGDGLYSYDDSLFNIIVDTKLGFIYVTDKGLFNLVYEDEGLGLSRLRFFNYDVEMYVSDEENGGFVVSYDPFLDNGVFKTFMTGFEPEPPINGSGLFGGLGQIFRDLFPDAEDLDGYGKFSRIFFTLLLVIGFGVLLSFHSPQNRGFIIPIISVISVMVLFFFIFIGYIPVWILIMSFLIGAGIIGVYIRKMGNSE